MAANTKRNYNLDLFRIFSMFCVILLHLLSHGGGLDAAQSNVGFVTLWSWNLIAYPAVTCFVLLAGYVGYREEKHYPKISNLLSIIFSTVFYSVVCYIVYVCIQGGGVSLKTLASAFIPVTTQKYWFVSAYVGMFLLSPVANLFVRKADRKDLFLTAVVAVILAVPSLLKDPFTLDGGFSTLWFILLYLLGATIKKENFLGKLSTGKYLLCIVLGLVLLLGSKLGLHFMGKPFSNFENFLVAYCSPPVLLMAFGWMGLFFTIRTKTPPRGHFLLDAITPSVFSVYLIHDNDHLKELFINGKFAFLAECNPLAASGILLGWALAIFAGCLVVDFFRVLLFRLLHIPQLTVFLEKQIKKLMNKLFLLWT